MKYVVIARSIVGTIEEEVKLDSLVVKLAGKFLCYERGKERYLVIGVPNAQTMTHAEFQEAFFATYGQGFLLLGAGNLSMGKIVGWESYGLPMVTPDDLRPVIRDALAVLGFTADITG